MRKPSGAFPEYHLAARPTKTLSENFCSGGKRKIARVRSDACVDENRRGRTCENLPEVERSRDPDREMIKVQESFVTSTCFRFSIHRPRWVSNSAVTDLGSAAAAAAAAMAINL
ncbi:hypothetical protein NL676_001600 [Syzygium grande]|nr:hypothetical protein NL676_001600 [Syzygium grande]